MNKFAPPTGDNDVAAETTPAEQAGNEQPLSASSAAGYRGASAQVNPTPPDPVGQPSPQMMRPSYGTFYTIYHTDRRSLRPWLVWGIGLTLAVLFTSIGIFINDMLYVAASVIGGIVCLIVGVTEAGWSRRLVSVVSTPEGSIVLRPSGFLMSMRLVGTLLTTASGVCFFFSFFLGPYHEVKELTTFNLLGAFALAAYLLWKIVGSQSGECIVISQERVDLWGKGGIHYSIPWNDQPKVIGQRNNGRSLLINVGQDVECPIVFMTLRLLPSRVQSMLAYYQKKPEALDRLFTSEAYDDAMKALDWR